MRPLRREESAILRLRELYAGYGYTHYRAGRFEEYELYSRNRSFLVDDRILTFTDTDGRLMAMRPDVTLSIVKNYSGEPLQKLCYNESVYRADVHGFRQIQQTGLECIGAVDDYLQAEVLMLACRSLQELSEDYLLDLSHMGFLSALLDALLGEMPAGGQDPETVRRDLLTAVGRKNAPAIRSICGQAGLGERAAQLLTKAALLYAPAEEGLESMKELCITPETEACRQELERAVQGLTAFLPEAKICLDLSLLSDMHYYNGIIFRGMLPDLPVPILSGGRYDNLLSRMKKQGKAIGFAIYMDLLERLDREKAPYDADVLLLYTPQDPPEEVIRSVEALRAEGWTVAAQTEAAGIRCRRMAHPGKGGPVFDV